jgi:3-oxoacyl-[acyl-carrier protein] reductase
MNLGIAGRWALVCAASKGVNVVITARGEQVLNETAGGS